MFTVLDHFYRRLHRGHNSTRSTTALHVQLVTEIVHITNYVYLINRSCRIDSTLSIIRHHLYYILYHGVRLVVRIETASKTIRTQDFECRKKFSQ